MTDRVKFDVLVGQPVDFDAQPPVVWIKEWPPFSGESSRDYRRRCMAVARAQCLASAESGRRMHNAAAWSMFAGVLLIIAILIFGVR